MQLPTTTVSFRASGSDGSAAGGGRSDLSEWQRSIKSRVSVSPKILSGTATETWRGNLIVQRFPVSYGLRIWCAQYIEIATPPSVVRNDTCGAK